MPRAIPAIAAASTARGSRLLGAIVASVIALWAAAPAASAGTEQYLYNANISAHSAYGSSSAHTGVDWTYAASYHTICPGVGSGWAGSKPGIGPYPFFEPPVFTAYDNCGYGGAIWYPWGTENIYFHGVSWNPNLSTTDNGTNSVYGW